MPVVPYTLPPARAARRRAPGQRKGLCQLAGYEFGSSEILPAMMPALMVASADFTLAGTALLKSWNGRQADPAIGEGAVVVTPLKVPFGRLFDGRSHRGDDALGHAGKEQLAVLRCRDTAVGVDPLHVVAGCRPA